ncbi:MAG TPA: outer membrane protein assembly factor BamA [Bacteroidetes bacterium]|nr:outer membrane protein assembly factor BamA [Bacteroidota bacterium]
MLLSCMFFVFLPLWSWGQTSDSIKIANYTAQAEYEIGAIKVTGAAFSDDNAIIAIAGLKVGDKIRVPGPEIPRAIKALWALRLFTDVQILKEKSIGEIIFLEIVVKERPRLTNHSFKGVKKSYHDDLNDAVNRFLTKGGIVTENIKARSAQAIKDFFRDKGFLDATVKVNEIVDKSRVNAVRLEFEIDRKDRVKIQDIFFVGNAHVKSRKLRKQMEETKSKRRIFASSKFKKPDYETDKKSIIAYYNTIGFRDAKIVKDSIWREEDGDIVLQLTIDEGDQYYFRNITWKGNSIYNDKTLADYFGIKKGDIYNQELLETRLQFSQDGRDISTLYMDNGYLFFQVNPIEVAIVKDSIDLEIRIYEGPQATIDKVTIKGNDRTHEHVIRRELRTLPGKKFSRSDIIRSQREIISLGYFNPEALGINTPVNPQRGTVDIEYTVEEKPSDQLELSAGWGGRGRGVIGTLGVSFNNFSVRNIFKKESWSPLPQGDGQRLSLRAQTNGRFFQSYNASFTEPWLGGKKPNSFTLGGYYTRLTNGVAKSSTNFQSLGIFNVSVSLGTRLKFPDDNFISSTSISFQNINLNNWTFRRDFILEDGTFLTEGSFNSISLNQTIARSSINDPLFPKSGSKISLSLQITPPFSLLTDKSYKDLSPTDKFRWVEYHKWRLNAEWYTQVFGKFVVKAGAKIGMLGLFNRDIGVSPFERFVLGGDGLANQQSGLLGYDLISLRGYEIEELPNSQDGGATVFDKFTVELRYPVSLNPSATIYLLVFAEGGNSWRSFRDFNPFDVRRAAGAGLRVFLPMFGTLGFDYGFGFDKPDIDALPAGDRKWTSYGNFNIILGFEPE